MLKKIIKVIVYIFVALLIIINVTILGMKMLGKQPSILGYHIYYIASGSMEPTIKTGQVIVGKETDIKDLEVDDETNPIAEEIIYENKIIEESKEEESDEEEFDDFDDFDDLDDMDELDEIDEEDEIGGDF